MAPPVTNTSSDPHVSTAHVTCAAHALDGEQRQRLALQVLTRSEPVTELAERHAGSRKFLYQHADKGAQALEQAFHPLPPVDDDVLFYLPVTKAWLRQVVLGLVLRCHSSFRGVIGFFRDLLDQPLALGTVHHRLAEAVVEARRINARQDLSRVRAGSHDELFQGRQPVGGGIDLDSTYCYLLAREAHGDAETWAIHLWDRADQGLQPGYIVADGGPGLRAGPAVAWPAVPCAGDLFHGRRTVARLVATLEKHAYAAIARREALEQKMQRAKHRGQGRPLSKPLAHARAQETPAIRLADEVQTLAGGLQHDIRALAGPAATTRQVLYDFVVAALQDLEAVEAKRLRPVRRALANQRDPRLAFATRLAQELETLAQPVAVPPARVRQLLALQSLPSTTSAYWAKAPALPQQLHDGCFPLQQALDPWRSRFHRPSSRVEHVNSRLRRYCFLRRQRGLPDLELLRFFLNHQPFSRSQKPEHRGKSPTELLAGQAHPHWLERLGFTRFTRACCAASRLPRVRHQPRRLF